MIYVSQGHEKGISLEVFFKAVLRLPTEIISCIELHANKDEVKKTLTDLDFQFQFSDEKILIFNKIVKIKPLDGSDNFQSSESLKNILNVIKHNDVLVTLPTSKDQLVHNDINCSGYTEFLRSYFKNDNLSMIFKGIDGYTLLLTDHIPLSQVPKSIKKELVVEKIRNSIIGLTKYFNGPDKFIFSGINPHAGEGGILGQEDEVITESLIALKKEFDGIKFIGPIPGDTLHFHERHNSKDVFVYAYHDQGLPRFKDNSGLFGINITLGLPFIRMSVDHGTAFSLYGKNTADCSGCLYVLKEAYKVMKHEYK